MAAFILNAVRSNFKSAYSAAFSRSLHLSLKDPINKVAGCDSNTVSRLSNSTGTSSQLLKLCNGFNLMFARTIVRIHFPKPCERKRIVRHGWKKRMSTPAGKRILMNRILKGRHVLSH